MASKANPGNRGTTQTGYGKHADRRTKRARTRGDQARQVLSEWDHDVVGEVKLPGPGPLWPKVDQFVLSQPDPLASLAMVVNDPNPAAFGCWLVTDGVDDYTAFADEAADADEPHWDTLWVPFARAWAAAVLRARGMPGEQAVVMAALEPLPPMHAWFPGVLWKDGQLELD